MSDAGKLKLQGWAQRCSRFAPGLRDLIHYDKANVLHDYGPETGQTVPEPTTDGRT